MNKPLLLLLISLFILSACSTSTTPTANNQKSFIGGTVGLIVNFVGGEPPADVTDGNQTPFTVSVKLENQGETSIDKDNVSLTLKGFDARTFGVANNSDLIGLSSPEDILKNEMNPDTGEVISSPPVYVTFPTLNYQSQLSGNSVFPFQIDVCYVYETRATSKLCIKENLFDSANTDVCTVSGSKDVQSSGAPVQVVDFQEFTAGRDAISFSFKIKNVGNGLLSKESSACDQTSVSKDFVSITVDAHMNGLTCSSLTNGAASGTAYTGEAKLSTGERQVRCTLQLDPAEKTDKVIIADISINYDYRISTSTNVLVKHI